MDWEVPEGAMKQPHGMFFLVGKLEKLHQIQIDMLKGNKKRPATNARIGLVVLEGTRLTPSAEPMPQVSLNIGIDRQR